MCWASLIEKAEAEEVGRAVGVRPTLCAFDMVGVTAFGKAFSILHTPSIGSVNDVNVEC